MAAEQQYDEVVLNAASGGGEPLPQHPAKPAIFKCVDLINLGKKVDSFQNGPKKITQRAAFVWLSSEKRQDGKNFEMTREFTVAGGDKATLPKFLGTWRGSPVTPAEVKAGLKLSERVGKVGIGQVLHRPSTKDPTRVYANVDSVTPLFDGIPIPQFPPYTRAAFWEERKKQYAAEVQQYEEEAMKSEALRASQQTIASQLNDADLKRMQSSVEAELPTFPGDAPDDPPPF